MDGPLHAVGRLELVDAARSVAIVGARAASRAGRERAFELAAGLTRAGWVVLSGGAIGIDAAAHQGGIAATVAVVAGGVTRPYPERNALLFDTLKESGAIVSPFADGERIQRWHFVRRNQIIAQLARAVIVVEAGAHSGSRHTALAARALGRVVGASPGSPGTTVLLAEGAALIETVDDVFAALAGQPRAPAPRADLECGRLFDELDTRMPRTVEDLADRTGLPLRQVAAELMTLELEGLALPAPGGAFLRAGGVGSL